MKKNRIDISIIVPIYNAEKYLNRCIDSLINQTKKELEIILINDGSTDDSEKIIKSYNDDRIKYFSNKNQGIGKTRNFGINKANGKYIMFCDSDDYYEKNACEEFYKKAEKDNLDLIICDFFVENDEGNMEEERLIDFPNTNLEKSPNLIKDINLAPWNKFYKKELIKTNKLKFVENLKYEDAPFVAEALGYAKKIGKINKCLNHYIVHESSETTIRDKKCFDIIPIIDKIRKHFKNSDYLRENLDKWTVRVLTNYTIQQRYQENKTTAMEFIDQAFDYMKKEVPDYKNKKYYADRGLFRYLIEKNISLTKIYCKLYKIRK